MCYEVTACVFCWQDAAWYYPEPKKAAENIKDYFAFWKGVKVGA